MKPRLMLAALLAAFGLVVALVLFAVDGILHHFQLWGRQ